MISRRKLIHGMGASVLFLNSSFGRAQQPAGNAGLQNKKFFVQLMADGGLDVTLGLDPYGLNEKGEIIPQAARFLEKDLFAGYPPSEILRPKQPGGYFLGPSAEPLLPYRDDISIINGIITSETDQFHDSNANHIRSGYLADKAIGLPASFALAQGPLPYNLLFHSEYGVTSPLLGKSKVKSFTMGDIYKPTEVDKNVEDFQSSDDEMEGSLYTAYEESMQQARLQPRVLEVLKALGGNSGDDRWMKIMAAFFLSGASDQADVGLKSASGSIDSHFEHQTSHPRAQKSIWSQVAKLFQLFKSIPYGSGSLFDSTLFMVGSEFSRTPFLNNALGKDHNPLTNSVLLAGYGIRGGQKVGASQVYTAREITRLAELKTAAGVPAKKVENFVERFTEDKEIRSAHIGSGIEFDASMVAQTVPKFTRGARITPGIVAITVQKAFGIPGTLPGIKDQTRWLQQLIKTKA